MLDLEEVVQTIGERLRAEFEADATAGDHPDYEARVDSVGDRDTGEIAIRIYRMKTSNAPGTLSGTGYVKSSFIYSIAAAL